MSVPRLTRREKPIYNQASRMLTEGTTAEEFSARFFGPSGSLANLAANEAERKDLVASELYRWLKARLNDLRLKESTAFDNEVQRASGRLTIAVARSLHAALKAEARFEGVSLSELIRLKLSVPYKTTAQLHLSDKQTTAGT